MIGGILGGILGEYLGNTQGTLGKYLRNCQRIVGGNIQEILREYFKEYLGNNWGNTQGKKESSAWATQNLCYFCQVAIKSGIEQEKLGKNEDLLVLPNQLNEESGFRSYVIHWMKNYSLNGIRGYYFHKEHTSLYRDLVSKQLGNMLTSKDSKELMTCLNLFHEKLDYNTGSVMANCVFLD